MYITKPEVTTKYIRIPVKKKLPSDRIRTITISSSKGIKALYSGNRKLILTYLFLRSKGWTMSKAKKWVKEHSKSMQKKITKSIEKKTAISEMARFSFAMPILKCYEEVHKDEDGKETKKRFIEGVASSTDIDLHGDQMAPSAIKSMAVSIKNHIIGLNAEHDKSWQSELGEVDKLSIDKKNRLVMKAQLDITSKANDLWYALTTKKKELGLSIGGFVKDYILEWDKKKEKFKRIFKDIELDHIAVTSTPANPKTWVGAIAKSIDKIERQKDFKSLDDMPKEYLVKFIQESLEKILGEENLKKLLTNFSLNFNEETIMSIKKKQSSLESEELKKKSSSKTKDEEAKDASELEDEEEDGNKDTSENPDNEDNNKADDTEDDSDDKSDDSDEDSADESDDSDDEDSDSDEDKKDEESDEDSKNSKASEDEDEKDEEDSDEEEEKSLTRKEVSEMITKGVIEGVKGFFNKLLGKSDEEDNKDESEDTEKSKDKTKDEAVDLLKSVVERQDKLEKLLKKRGVNRKTVKSVAINKDEEESKDEEGVYKTLDEELEAVKKQHANDPERAFAECGKVRKKWAEKEQ